MSYRVSLAVAKATLLVSSALACGNDAQNVGRRATPTTSDLEAVLEAVGTRPLDSLCGSTCRTIFVDTVVRYFPGFRSDTLATGRSISIPWATLRSSLRAGAELRPASFALERIRGDSASAFIYIARDSLVESRREIGVTVDATGRRGSVVRVFVQHDGQRWRVLDSHIEFP